MRISGEYFKPQFAEGRVTVWITLPLDDLTYEALAAMHRHKKVTIIAGEDVPDRSKESILASLFEQSMRVAVSQIEGREVISELLESKGGDPIAETQAEAQAAEGRDEGVANVEISPVAEASGRTAIGSR